MSVISRLTLTDVQICDCAFSQSPSPSLSLSLSITEALLENTVWPSPQQTILNPFTSSPSPLIPDKQKGYRTRGTWRWRRILVCSRQKRLGDTICIIDFVKNWMVELRYKDSNGSQICYSLEFRKEERSFLFFFLIIREELWSRKREMGAFINQNTNITFHSCQWSKDGLVPEPIIKPAFYVKKCPQSCKI